MNYRNRKLLDAARDQPCMHCGMQDGTIVAAHSNWSRHGKGMSIKAHDCFIAFLCSSCHHEIDQGSKLTKIERQQMWQDAFEKTLLHLWSTERLTVK
jgi:hypothetical protein